MAAAVLMFMEPWVPSSSLVYETVSGWPMRVYYRNVGTAPERAVAVSGMPSLSVDRPLSQGEIDARFGELMTAMTPADTTVKGGDYVRFEVNDPDGLAWQPGKMEKTSWFYLFVVVESARHSLLRDKWISELCLVSKTREPFAKCDTHNRVYAK